MDYTLIFPQRDFSNYHFPSILGESYSSTVTEEITIEYPNNSGSAAYLTKEDKSYMKDMNIDNAVIKWYN